MPKVKTWPDFVKVKPKGDGYLKRKFEEFEQPRFPNNPAETDQPRALQLSIPVGNTRSSNPLENHSTFNVKLDLALKCEEILNQAKKSPNDFILSFDLDWPSLYRPVVARTSSVHICYGENTCAHFEVSGLTRIPFVLIELLKHQKVKLIGNNLKKDITKFSFEFKLDAQTFLNNIKESTDKDCDFNLSCKHGWKLTSRSDDVKILEIPPISPVEYIAFKGKIEYSTNFLDCAAFSHDLLKLADESNPFVLGFDLEWPFSRFGSGKTALIQICPNESICYIFHVFHLPKLPASLVQLLCHSNVRLTGLNIINDLRKLGRDFGLTQIRNVIKNNMVELTTLANQKLNCFKRWSLKGLCFHQLGLDLDKGPRKSSWDKVDLTPRLKLYAATDAYVSLLCYKSLTDCHDVQSGGFKIE